MSAIVKCSEGSTKGRHSWLSTGMVALCVALLGATAAYADTSVDWTKYNYSFTVRFAGYAGNTTLTDFPVLVRVSEDRISFPIYAKCKIANGGDLRFSDASGALLASEVECWNPGGESLVWVKVPSLNADTVITGHFGCSSPDAVTPSDVWSNGFLGVWHLGAAEGSSTQPDSVADGSSFVNSQTYPDGVLAGTNGVAGLAAAFNQRSDNKGVYSISDGSGKYSGFEKFTVEYWTYYDDHDVGGLSKNARVLNKNNAWSAYEASSNGKMGLSFKAQNQSGDKYVIPANNQTKPQKAEWNYTVSVFDGRESPDADTLYNRAAYLNGQSLTTTATNGLIASMASNNNSLFLGNVSDKGTEPYHGIIDEVRLSTMTRSADWVKATYDTIANNDQFAVYEGPQLDWTVYDWKFPLTFDGVTDGATLTDFPVLVRISEYDEATGKGIRNFDYDGCLLPDGGDLRFADENGTLLMSEVDTWNANGESLVWVKIPALTKGTKIWAYYGSKYAHAVNPKAVWSNGFLGVWHLSAAGGSATQTQLDSVDGGNAFTNTAANADGVLAGTNGIAGLAAAFHQRSDGKGAYCINDPEGKYSGFSTFTVEYWTYQNDHDVGTKLSSNTRVLYKQDVQNSNNAVWSAYESGDSNSTSNNGRMGLSFKIPNDTSEKYVIPTAGQTRPQRAEWNYTVSVFDGTYEGQQGPNADTRYNRAPYLNGALLTFSSTASIYSAMSANTNPLYLGNKSGTATESYRGLIDEVRISTVTRSAAWVKATYDTIANNAAFVAYGAVRQNNKGGLMVFIR